MKGYRAGFLSRKHLVLIGIFLAGTVWTAGFLPSCGMLPDSAGCFDYCANDSACKDNLYCWKGTCVPFDCEHCFYKDDTCEFTKPDEVITQKDDTPTSEDSSMDITVTKHGECEFIACGDATRYNFTLKDECHHYSQEGCVICSP